MKTTPRTSGCPLVKAGAVRELPRMNATALATLAAFGFGLMAAAISSGPF